MAKIETYSQLCNYFKEIARRLKFLNPDNEAAGRFFEGRNDLPQMAMPETALVLLPDEWGIGDGRSDNIFKNRTVELVLAKSGKLGDEVSNSAIWDELETIAWQLISRIKADYEMTFPVDDRQIFSFDLNSVEVKQAEPFGPNYMLPLLISFNFGNPKQLQIDDTKWH